MQEFRFLSHIIKSLKRQFPAEIILIDKTKAVTNFDTGKINHTKSSHTIYPVVLLPQEMAFSKEDKLVEGTRTVLVDMDDVSFDVTSWDQVQIEGKICEVTKVRKHADVILELTIKGL